MGLYHSLISKLTSLLSPGDEFNQLTRALSYSFQNKTLLRQALTHPSMIQESSSGSVSYERLEFLGDAVLELVISDYLYHRFPYISEGALTQKRATLVNQTALERIGRRLHIPDYILSQDVPDRPIEQSSAVISDVVESILGAIYLDGGLHAAEQTIYKQFPLAEAAEDLDDQINYKGKLIEYCHMEGLSEPVFETIDKYGPDHSRQYKVAVRLNEDIVAVGDDSSKKKAGQGAAKQALSRLQKRTISTNALN
ncbi:MAG: ribonuclease III [Candidatus Marinimicrobia bacterium]|nr:ribonuclease III [Candidatus Neomarinimicrobiota bacterium]MCF7830098.1 ribonuclease III [Candidatus Neomarinimicrobiota bacterium]MCF7882145.1 ribonuclease III [Candidatus Neomarinimicrobiota bacterium]